MYSGNLSQTFRDLSVPSSKGQDETGRFSRNVGDKLPLYTEERSSIIHVFFFFVLVESTRKLLVIKEDVPT